MSTTATPSTQVASAPQGGGSASVLTAPYRGAAQREGSSSNLGTFGVRTNIDTIHHRMI
jgi:hypothetical protein